MAAPTRPVALGGERVGLGTRRAPFPTLIALQYGVHDSRMHWRRFKGARALCVPPRRCLSRSLAVSLCVGGERGPAPAGTRCDETGPGALTLSFMLDS